VNKILAFLATFSILMALNFGAAYLFQANIVDLTFPVGILGILITAQNNPMTDLFNSQTSWKLREKEELSLVEFQS
jgi:hypothetical protein